MYQSKYIVPNNKQVSYQNLNNYHQDERFLPFLGPFIVGGVAGTALGYGLANNNQINKQPCCGQPVYYYPYPPQYPMYNQNYYY